MMESSCDVCELRSRSGTKNARTSESYVSTMGLSSLDVNMDEQTGMAEENGPGPALRCPQRPSLRMLLTDFSSHHLQKMFFAEL